MIKKDFGFGTQIRKSPYFDSTVNWGATGVTQTNNNKFAMSWGSGTMKFYVNGTQTNTETVTSPIGLNVLEFNTAVDTLFMEANVKCVAVFKEALDNDQLERLTGEGYESFNLLAQANNYTII